MSFLNKVAKSFATGTQTAFAAPWTAYKGTQISLNGVTVGIANAVSAAGLIVSCSGPTYDLEWESLCANVQSVVVSAATIGVCWQGSQDATNWVVLYPLNVAAFVTVGAAGATTTWVQSAAGLNCPYPYLRLAAFTATATGGASDTITIAYNFRRRIWV